MDYISRLPVEIYSLFILNTYQKDRWRIYNCLLCIPAFARTLTPGRILDFMEICGVDVKVCSSCRTRTIIMYGCLKWTLNGQEHRADGPSRDYENGVRVYYINGALSEHRSMLGIDGIWHDIGATDLASSFGLLSNVTRFRC